MNKVLPLFAAVLFLLSACRSDFKVGADYKDVTIVYCLLSTSDANHYVKVTKGFFDEKQDNLLLAQIADSIYFKNLELKFEEISNGSVANTHTLSLVDLNLEGFPKDSGVFAQSPNYAYKYAGTLDVSRTYRLKLKNLSTGKEIEGETPIINSGQLKFSNPFTSQDRLNFAVPFEKYNFAWSAPGEAVFFDVVLRFWYEEKNVNTLEIVHKFKELPLLRNVTNSGGGVIIASMTNEDFYRALNSELGTAPAHISRYVDTPDLILIAGGQVLKTYIDASSAQGGITYDQIKPNYTNLKGEDVLGILSTRGKSTIDKIAFGKVTLDSILYGSLTKNLNFAGVSSQ